MHNATIYGAVTVSQYGAGTWLQSENAAYPSGGMVRKGSAILARNPHNPLALPYGSARAVRGGIPDTFYSIPARLRIKGKTVRGYLSLSETVRLAVGQVEYAEKVLTFTPEAEPEACQVCEPGKGCRR